VTNAPTSVSIFDDGSVSTLRTSLYATHEITVKHYKQRVLVDGVVRTRMMIMAAKYLDSV